MTTRILAALLACCCALPAAAILIRADRDDSEYLELATRYASSVPLDAPDGEGVLIASRWVLTAAHRVKALQEMKPVPRIPIGSRPYEIAAFFRHPEWKHPGPNDIGLLYLKEPVRGVEPTSLYRATDEMGKGVVIVGHGDNGRIGERPLPKSQWDRKKRAAINTVDRVTERVLWLRIKPPEEASDLQGAAAPGDSGGPAYIETPEGIFVAGIGYATEDHWEAYARASYFLPWIEATMLSVAIEEARALLGD